ncbi:MAG: hypothetical protein HOO06_10395 [Bdellovibrionaceae bacterium]|jgi:hypothetical protein|nr:hypothetical protein [Pseudobdellovibrionaceae bacterium]
MNNYKLYTLILVILGSSVLKADKFDGRDHTKTNTYINDVILEDLPYLFTVPLNAYAKDTVNPDKDVLFQYIHENSGKKENQKIGLKLYFVNKKLEQRKDVAAKLHKSNFVKDGDVLLTYHPEWGFTGPYTSVMTGISHAGMAYVSDGKIANIDMPLNESMNLDIRSSFSGSTPPKSYLSSDHYVKHTAFVHVVRPRFKDTTNLKKWAEVFEKQVRGVNPRSIYGSKTTFNSSYLAPAYMLHGLKDPASNEPLYTPHVYDLARIGLGGNLKENYKNPKNGSVGKLLPLFCSDYIWALHALKNCDPQVNLNQCTAKESFKPLPLIGSIETVEGVRTYSPGLTDAAYLVLQAMNLSSESLISKKVKEIFGGPNGSAARPMRNVSSGHKAAAKAIPQETYNGLSKYLNAQLTGELRVRQAQKAKASGDDQKALALSAESKTYFKAAGDVKYFLNNSDMPANYSPTTFLIQSMLPNLVNGQINPKKVYDYVGTIAYVSDQQMRHLVKNLKKDVAEAKARRRSGSTENQEEAPQAITPAPEQSTAGFKEFRDVDGLNALLARNGMNERNIKYMNGQCSKRHKVNKDYGLMHPTWGYGDCQPMRKALKYLGHDWRSFTVGGSL